MSKVMIRGTTRGPLLTVAERARQLAEAGAHNGTSWSLAQICDHLALSITSTLGEPTDQAPSRRACRIPLWARLKRWVIKQFILRTGWFPRNVPAPNSVRPKDAISLEAGLTRLERAAEAFEARAAGKDSTWPNHSILGTMSASGWRRFHHIHAAHHFSFVKSVDGMHS